MYLCMYVCMYGMVRYVDMTTNPTLNVQLNEAAQIHFCRYDSQISREQSEEVYK